MNPDYGGRGPTWRNATYRGVNVDVPEIRHEYAGPHSTVLQSRFPALAGLGQDDEMTTLGPEPLVSVAVEEFAYPDLTDLPEGYFRDYLSEYKYIPMTIPRSEPKSGFPWWILLAGGALLFLSKKR